MDTDFLSPLLIAADPFTVGVDGDVATINPIQIINPNRTAMLVDEFRFNVAASNVLAVELATMQAKLSLGSAPLTNDFIPLHAFAPGYLLYLNNLTLTWHLARPMYVPPDVQVNVAFKRKLPFSSWDNDIVTTERWGFSIAGRSMPSGMQVPDKIFVPWACATNVYSSAVPFVSSDADIVNPFDEPLNIDYLTGFNITEDFNPLKAPLTVQMTLSNGKVLARDPIPFFSLFPVDRPILRMRSLLQPKEFVSVVIDVPQTAGGDDDDAQFTTIGMTGWRELKTPLGALP